MLNKSPARFLARLSNQPNVFPRARCSGVVFLPDPVTYDTKPIPSITPPKQQAAVYGLSKSSVFYGTVSPLTTEGNTVTFDYAPSIKKFPKGRYKIVYDSGALKYNGSLFTLGNDYAPNGYFLVKDKGLTVLKIDLSSAGYLTQAEAEERNAGTELTFWHAGGSIGLMFQCLSYTNNEPGTSAPVFGLYKAL